VISIGYLHCSPESFHVNLASRVQYLRWSGNEQRLAHGGARLDDCVSETDNSATTVEQPECGFSDVAARTASRSSVSTPTGCPVSSATPSRTARNRSHGSWSPRR
jgi:hypothetical protein